MLFYYVQLLLY